MKIVRLHFDDGIEKTVNASDPDIRCVRTSDDLIVGDLCRYPIDGRLITAEVLDVADIKVEPTAIDLSTPSSFEQQLLDELQKIKETIKNEVVNEIQKLSTVFQNFNTLGVRSEGHQDESSFVQHCDTREPTTDILELVPENSENWRPRRVEKRSRRLSTPISVASDESYHQNQCRTSVCFPSDTQVLVETPDGSYLPLRTLHYGYLVEAFEAKWKRVKLPPIAEKLNMQLAVRHLLTPCINSFKETNPRLFMYAISCYLFDLDVLRTAFLPHRSDGMKHSRGNRNPHKRDINLEATEAFFFLVDYFSTILVEEKIHAIWHSVVRNCFNHSVNENLKQAKRRRVGDGMAHENSFLLHVIPGHQTIFNTHTAF